MAKLSIKEKREVLHNSCAFYRGNLIHHYTILEAHIDEIICSYFLGNKKSKKRIEFMNVIMSSEKMNWFHKSNIIYYLIGAYCPVFSGLYNPSKKKDYVTFNTRLGNIIAERNKIAHRKYLPSFKDIAKVKNIKSINDLIEIDFDTIKQGSKGLTTDKLKLSIEVLRNKIDEITAIGYLLNEMVNELIPAKNKKTL